VNIRDLFDLSGQNAIVTGGGAGLGRQIAEALAEAGANVVLCARKPERCEELAASLSQATGVKAFGMRCDVKRRDEIDAVVERTVKELGSVDILVNNAGTSWGAPAEDYPIESWQKVIDVNLTGVFHFSQSAGRKMIGQNSGKIINVSSVAAFGGGPPERMNAIAYNASKGGVVSFTRDLAVKWAQFGVRVNALAPGWFPSEMSDVVLGRSREEFLSRIPLHRFGNSDDLKGAVVFLASRASDFITGETVVIDGGQSAVTF
jgi:gluconate 5-dehydrogenase